MYTKTGKGDRKWKVKYQNLLLYASRLSRIKTEHGVIGTFLKRIGVLQSAEC